MYIEIGNGISSTQSHEDLRELLHLAQGKSVIHDNENASYAWSVLYSVSKQLVYFF